jgi:hypothetical protein
MTQSQGKTAPEGQRGQANLASALFVIALIVAGIWGWHHLSFDAQDIIIEEVIPVVILTGVASLLVWLGIKKIRKRRNILKRRDKLIQQFTQETSIRKRFDLAAALIELNNYERQGLESIAPAMAQVFASTIKTSLGDKQHRVRGMAASHLGVLEHRESIPLLIRALEDDHAYVRGCAALALGRMRAVEAKAKLEITMKEDWDQTVRSRSREAVERMG